MQDTQLLHEGLALMGLGMGFVFVFLTVLVISVTLMSGVIRRFAPEAAPAATGKPATPTAPGTPQEDELKVVISTAIHRYRNRHRN
ncbi:OadG family protein [Vreelandella rituensis]|uniref:Probable oxaloacetate decarboxylase gamma chain n=1 Tax=Vreelandella rituensis TaxID=2282306 RepID=A0A368U4B3_9GAMM|nr:OadG family protein [Halomonas rituensis]RCV91366.1 sodium pump decarboxylase subunit gamma [Halomonas rituensis]